MNDQRNGGIAWCDFTANPIRYRKADGKSVWACVKVSPGCAHCYSATMANRFGGADYNADEMAKLTPYLDENELQTLLTSKKISDHRVFIADMTDVFGEWVSFETLDKLFAAFALRPDVTFQLLTKRPERMREYLTCERPCDGYFGSPNAGPQMHAAWRAGEMTENGDAMVSQVQGCRWPLPNVWLAVSVENQETADARIPVLLQTPAAVRFVSYEPALGPVNFDLIEIGVGVDHGALDGAIDWLIVGGESGIGARPFDVAWARSTVEQCKAAGVACFVKQLGAHARISSVETPIDPPQPRKRGGFYTATLKEEYLPLKDRKGGDPSEWAEDLRVREFPQVTR